MDWKLIAQILAATLGLISKRIEDRGSDELKADIENIRDILDAIDSGDLSRLTAEVAQDSLDKLKLALMEHDAKADEELRRRFPRGS